MTELSNQMSKALLRVLWASAVVIIAFAHSNALAQSATQPTRDGRRILINKEVNSERWAITYDAERSSVSGNVLLPDGGVAFIDCGIEGSFEGQINLTCYSAEAAAWNYIGPVTLPLAFFGLDQPTTCQERQFTDGWWWFSYSDSCGHTGRASIWFDQIGCGFSGATYDEDGVYASGLQVSGELVGATDLTLRVEFTGACQGSATGVGSLVRWTGTAHPVEGDIMQATVRGTSTCCDNLEAQIGFRW